MAAAASALVSIERGMLALAGDGLDAQALATRQKERAEAASLLERRMSAMEALLTGEAAARLAMADRERLFAEQAVFRKKYILPGGRLGHPSLTVSVLSSVKAACPFPAAGQADFVVMLGQLWASVPADTACFWLAPPCSAAPVCDCRAACGAAHARLHAAALHGETLAAVASAAAIVCLAEVDGVFCTS
jgi:hypothetical protein